MSLTTYPTTPPPAFPLIKQPMFRTAIVDYGNKAEQRIALDSAVRHRFRLRYDSLEIDDLDTVRAFFEARQGALTAFYFQNPEEANGRVWLGSHAYALGEIVRPVTANGHSYKCTVAGTSGSGTPAWSTTEGATVVDGGVTWTENTYTVRFETDELNLEYFNWQLYNLGEVALVEVSS